MMTTTLRNSLLNNWFRGTSYSMPSTYYIGLSTTDPLADGTNVHEPSGKSYKRVAVAANSINFATASDGKIANNKVIRFSEALEVWADSLNPITHYVIYDAQKGGNLLFFGALTRSIEVPISSIVEVPIGGIVTELSNIS